jgi:hypothetical protein
MKYTAFIIIFFIAGCVPYMTYEEMEEAHEIAETKEEKDALMIKIRTFEDNWEKSIIFFENKRACHAKLETTWYCADTKSTAERRIRNVDALVRVYKRERLDCGCVNSKRALEALRR